MTRSPAGGHRAILTPRRALACRLLRDEMGILGGCVRASKGLGRQALLLHAGAVRGAGSARGVLQCSMRWVVSCSLVEDGGVSAVSARRPAAHHDLPAVQRNGRGGHHTRPARPDAVGETGMRALRWVRLREPRGARVSEVWRGRGVGA